MIRIMSFNIWGDYFGNPVELKDVFDDLLYNTGEFDNTNAFLPFKDFHN